MPATRKKPSPQETGARAQAAAGITDEQRQANLELHGLAPAAPPALPETKGTAQRILERLNQAAPDDRAAARAAAVERIAAAVATPGLSYIERRTIDGAEALASFADFPETLIRVGETQFGKDWLPIETVLQMVPNLRQGAEHLAGAADAMRSWAERESPPATRPTGIGEELSRTAVHFAPTVVTSVAAGPLGAYAGLSARAAQLGAVAVTSGAQTAVPLYHDILAATVDDEHPEGDRDKAAIGFVLGLGIGATDMVGAGSIVTKLDRAMGGGLIRYATEVATEALTEAGQEAFQQTLEDAARTSLTPEELTFLERLDRAGHAGLLGGLFGGGVSGVALAPGALARPPAQAAPAAPGEAQPVEVLEVESGVPRAPRAAPPAEALMRDFGEPGPAVEAGEPSNTMGPLEQLVARIRGDMEAYQARKAAPATSHASVNERMRVDTEQPAGARRGFRQEIEGMKAERQAWIDQVGAEVERTGAAEVSAPDGRAKIVSKDHAGKWRVTTLDASGTPTGHMEASSLEEAAVLAREKGARIKPTLKLSAGAVEPAARGVPEAVPETAPAGTAPSPTAETQEGLERTWKTGAHAIDDLIDTRSRGDEAMSDATETVLERRGGYEAVKDLAGPELQAFLREIDAEHPNAVRFYEEEVDLAEPPQSADRRYTAGVPARLEGESVKAYAKRAIDVLPDPGPLPDVPSDYFEGLEGATLIPLDKLQASKADQPSPTAAKRFAAAREGALPKRPPIDVRANADGTYTVLDGNGTVQSARLQGWKAVPARVQSEAPTRQAKPVPPPARPRTPEVPVKGTMRTLSGREIPYTRTKATHQGEKAEQTWLRQQAIDEAHSKGDEFAQFQFELMKPGKMSPADKTSANFYLFGEDSTKFPSAPVNQKAPTRPLTPDEEVSDRILRGEEVTLQDLEKAPKAVRLASERAQRGEQPRPKVTVPAKSPIGTRLRDVQVARQRAEGASVAPNLELPSRRALAKRYETAPADKLTLDMGLASAAREVGATYQPGPIKGLERATDKLAKYQGNVKRLKDVVRGTILLNNLDSIDQVLDAIRARFPRVLEVDDRFAQPLDTGYRDMQVIVEVNGHPAEVQVHIPEMLAAKNGPGHKLFDEYRKINEKAMREPLNEAEQARLLELRAAQRELYEAAWTAFLTRVRKTSSETSLPLSVSRSAQLKGLEGKTSNALQPEPSGEKITGTPSTTKNEVPGRNEGQSGITTSIDRVAQEAAPEQAETAASARPVRIITRPGAEGELELADGRTLPVTYALVEAGELVPSHDARAGFRKNPLGDLNERPYDDPVEGQASRETVYSIAEKPKPNLLTTDNPTPMSGPPVVTSRGVVLGGNARAMGMQLAYHRGGPASETIREAMVKVAKRYGIETFGIKEPVLVRMLPEGKEGGRGELSRVLNESGSTGKGAKTEAVSRGSKVTAEVAQEIGNIVGEGTLLEAIGTTRGARDVTRALVQAGALTQRDLTTLFDPTSGLPTQAGKQVIEDALLGAVVSDVRTLSELPRSARNTIVRALPSLIALKGRSPGFAESILNAAKGAAEVAQTGSPLADVLRQQVLPGVDVGWKQDAQAVGILRAMLKDKPTAFAARMAALAGRARDMAGGQASFIAEENLPIGEQIAREFGVVPPSPVREPAAPAAAQAVAPIETAEQPTGAVAGEGGLFAPDQAQAELEAGVLQFSAFPGGMLDPAMREVRKLLERFRRTPPLQDGAAPIASASWTNKAVQHYADYFEPVARLERALAGERRPGQAALPDLEDAYLQETLRRGRSKDQLETLEAEHQKPILQVMRRARITAEEADTFLMARNAHDGNKLIRARNQDPRLAYAPSTDLQDMSEFPTGERNLTRYGMTDEEATAILEAAAADPRAAAFEELGSRFDALNSETLDRYVATGRKTQEQIDALRKAQPHYAPGRTDMRGPDGKPVQVPAGKKRVGQPFKKALGRESRAEFPLAFAFAQAEQSIVQGEINRTRLAFMRMVRAYAGDLGEAVKVVEVPMQRVLGADGQVREAFDRAFQGRPDVVVAWENGKPVAVQIAPEHADLALALQQLGPKQLEGAAKLASAFNRLRSAMITRYRPFFWPRNMMRDVKSAFYLGSEFGVRHAARTVADVPRALATLSGKRTNLTPYVERYKKAGAKITFLDFSDLSTQLDRMQAALADPQTSTGDQALEGFKAIKRAMEKASDIGENATRFSAFVHAIDDLGWTDARAAAYAKEMQNFERKGLYGNQINAWYLFANAGTQSTRRFGQALRHPAIRKMLAASFVASMGWDSLMRALGGQDDDGEDNWDKIPDWERQGNFTFMYPDGSGRHVNIPASFSFGALNYTGMQLGALLTGNIGPGQFLASTTEAWVNSTNPLGSISGGDGQGLLRALTPDIARLPLELATNRDWRGKPIYPEDYGSDKPAVERSWPDTNPLAKAAAQWLSTITGGDKYEAGAIDVSPESLEHVAYFFGAGLPQDVLTVGQQSRKLAAGEPIPMRDVPLLKQIIRDPSPFQSWSEQEELLDSLKAEAARAKDEKRSLSKHARAVIEIGQNVVKARKKAREALDAMPEEKKQLELQRLDLEAQRFNKNAREVLRTVTRP